MPMWEEIFVEPSEDWTSGSIGASTILRVCPISGRRRQNDGEDFEEAFIAGAIFDRAVYDFFVIAKGCVF